MAALDGSIQLSTEGSGKLVDNTRLTAAASSDDVFRQRIVIAGHASSASFIDPSSAAFSSDAYSLPVRLNAGSTDYLLGAVAFGAGSTVSVAPTSQWTVTAALAAGSTASVAPTSQWTVTAALAAASTLSVAPTSQWTVTAALAVGSTVSVSGSSIIVAPTSQWTVTAALAAASTISVAPTSQWTVTAALAVGSTVSVSGSSIIVAPTSQWTVTAALAAGSTASVAPTSQWTVTAALAAGSTMSVAPTSQWTVTAALAAASTISAAPTSQWTVTAQVSTAETVATRDKFGITANRTLKTFYSTGFTPPTASTALGMNQVTGLSSGSSGTSFNVTAGSNFRITWINGSAQATTANSGWVDFIIKGEATTGGTTNTDVNVWGPHRVTTSIGGTTTVVRQGEGSFALSGLDIVLPSDASFGGFVYASSSTLEANFSFGGYEFTP